MDIDTDKIEMIMRQTTYDETTAREKLAEHQNNVMQVIREYLKGGKTEQPPVAKLSTNQQIYKEIRGMMDDAAKTYLVKRDAETQQTH